MTTARRLGAGEGDILGIEHTLSPTNLLAVYKELFGINRWKVETVDELGILSVKGLVPLGEKEQAILLVDPDYDLWNSIMFRAIPTFPEELA